MAFSFANAGALDRLKKSQPVSSNRFCEEFLQAGFHREAKASNVTAPSSMA
jgi:hypothetical protein